MNMPDGVQFEFVKSNHATLHVAQAGPSDGPLVILLHGFPEFWYAWRHQIPRLAAEGFRVWAPDQRGYNLSDKPRRVQSYGVDELAADVVGLIDAAGEERAMLVGHDWGGGVAWWVATKYASRTDRLVILNTPHGVVMQRHLWRNWRQLVRSRYIFFFQLPWLPEAVARLGNWRQFTRGLRRSAREGVFTDHDLGLYRDAWSQPGAFRSMVNWYRALFRASPTLPEDLRVRAPTLLIWGVKDKFLGREMAQPSLDLCDDGRLVFIEEATHWVQHEEPDRVNDLIVDFLGK